MTDESSSPLAALPVHLRSGDNLYSLSTNTAVDGEYLLGAFAGTWYVRAETEAQGFTAATESEVTLLSGQTGQVDFVATSLGGGESCTVCHSVMTEGTICQDCHVYNASAGDRHHETELTSTWGYGCLDCHFLGALPVTGVFGVWLTTAECISCHESLYPEKLTMGDVHHNLTP